MERKFKYRLEIDYLSKEYDDMAIGTSSPISSLEEGLARYEEAIKEKCVDNEEISARVHLWEYVRKGGRTTYKTIRKNYEGGSDPI